jgi:hypothetical protein
VAQLSRLRIGRSQTCAAEARGEGKKRKESFVPATVDQFTAGLPVEVGEIQRELKRLWGSEESVMTRASLINLAVYSEQPDSLGKNTAIICQLTENHACRVIVIAADPDAAESGVQAWISAHCHVGHAGRKQVCSEQLSFSIRGEHCGLYRTLFSRSSIPICRFISGGRRNSGHHSILSSGPGSIGSSTTVRSGAISMSKCGWSKPPRRKRASASCFAT